jgi:BlaI family transcriptional regulator, penicillinase repressor
MAKKPRPALTKLEGEIMRAVWDAQPQAVRVRDVLEAVNARRADPLAYNTVQTMLTILREKGFVQVVDESGRAHRFRARVSQTDVSRHMVRDLLGRMFSGRVQPLLQQLIDEADLNPSDLEQLRAWIDAKLSDTREDRR